MTFNNQINSKWKAYRNQMKNYCIIYVVRYLFIRVLAFNGIYKVTTLLFFINNTVKK